jgi:hypothetical protein
MPSLGLVPNGVRSVKPIPAHILSMVPKPDGDNQIHKKSGTDPERDTVPLIIELAQRQKWQGKRLAQYLKGNSTEQTVRNNWDFFIKHIQYKKDPKGSEDVRSLRRLVHNAAEGGDCDCFVNGLANLLLNQGIDFKLRIAKYNGSGNYSHIYIVVPTSNGDYITLDPVVHQYNTEVPFTGKKDFDMQLRSLDGFGACPTKAATPSAQNVSSSARTAPKISYTTKQNLTDLQMKSTYDVLDQAQIPYTTYLNNADQLIIQASTPNGVVNLPSVLDANGANALLQSATATPALQTLTASAPVSTRNIIMGVAGLALLAWVLSGNNEKQKDKPALNAPEQKRDRKKRVK